MKKSKMLKSELPDYVISYIFSKLNLKELVKTSALSKRWVHEWGFIRMDINFDFHNMFDTTELPKSLPLFQDFQSQFATRLDQFMLHHQGSTIHSIRVDFPLGDEHSDIIDRMISKGISKGAKHIELLFSHHAVASDLNLETKPYKFSFTLLSETDSLMYLHLEKCLIVEPTADMSGLKNLRTLVLHQVVVNQDMIHGLFSNCIRLRDFTLNACNLKSDLKIMSSTLFHLNIVHCKKKKNIDIIASNLSSIDYCYNHKYAKHTMNIKAHMLSKFSYKGSKISKRLAGFSGMRNVKTIVLDGLKECLSSDVLPLLFSECLQIEDVTFKHCWIILNLQIINAKLRCLNIIDCSYTDRTPLYIDIDAPNLESFEYIGQTRLFKVKAPRLLKVFWNAAKRDKNPYPFGPIARLHHIQNLAIIINPSQITDLLAILLRFQNLRQLQLFIEGVYDLNMDYFWILDLAMASQHLQKLSMTIRNLHMENSHIVGFKRQRREYAKFSHNELKYVELCGFVCTINAIELASQILRNANSLQKITFIPRDKFYMGAGEWTESSDGCWFEKNIIHEMLKDEVNEQCRVIIL